MARRTKAAKPIETEFDVPYKIDVVYYTPNALIIYRYAKMLLKKVQDAEVEVSHAGGLQTVFVKVGKEFPRRSIVVPDESNRIPLAKEMLEKNLTPYLAQSKSNRPVAGGAVRQGATYSKS